MGARFSSTWRSTWRRRCAAGKGASGGHRRWQRQGCHQPLPPAAFFPCWHCAVLGTQSTCQRNCACLCPDVHRTASPAAAHATHTSPLHPTPPASRPPPGHPGGGGRGEGAGPERRGRRAGQAGARDPAPGRGRRRAQELSAGLARQPLGHRNVAAPSHPSVSTQCTRPPPLQRMRRHVAPAASQPGSERPLRFYSPA